jgi:hypothetical protein
METRSPHRRAAAKDEGPNCRSQLIVLPHMTAGLLHLQEVKSISSCFPGEVVTGFPAVIRKLQETIAIRIA